MGGFAILLVLFLALTIEPFILMLLWNWLATKLFGMPEIGFCEAFGLIVLMNILFSAFRRSDSKD